MISYDDFEKIDIRTGEIIQVDDFPRARKPSYIVTNKFGSELGCKRSSLQATNYHKEQLLGLQVVCVLNFAPKNIAGFMSEVLVLGVPGEDDKLSLLTPTRKAILGSRVY
jgi:tRNA-binding protein